jgi:acetyl-CoA acetyltransferase family protein
MVLMNEARATAEGRSPLARIVGWSWAGVPPEIMGIGPVPATQKVLDRTGLTMADIDLIEINEAFAAQVLACLRCVKSDEFARKFLKRERHLGKIEKDRLNVNGGAIALGHPVGASGARLILTSLKELARRGQKRALVSLCVGGGQGAAIWLERM